ncbi:MAG: DUF3618 domain-containing protein [Verrucomicrobia bacterium]|nr:DUF3618 domain-containing protein [Verrucomicrobiota bacterium]
MDSSKIKRGVTPNGGSHDSDEILSEIRTTRTRMDHTLDELGDKLQPRHLMEDAVDYFWTRERHTADKAKQSVNKMGRKVVDEVREHPLPSLLIGAGVIWLLSQQRERARSVDSGEEAGPGLKEKASEALDSAKERLQGLKESAKESTESMKEKASEVSGKAREKIGSALGTAGEKSSEIKEKAKGYYQQTSQRVQETAQTHPLAVGLGCMAAGLIAGVIAPRTRAEDETFGSAADRLKEEGKRQAGEIAEKGSHVASHAMEAAKAEARQQDLTPEGLTGKGEEFIRPGEPQGL